MVFVTTGNGRQGFRRLVAAVDRLAQTGFFQGEEVLVQAGYTTDCPVTACNCIDFLSPNDFITAVDASSLIITHGGTSQLQIVRSGKVPVSMPRRRHYGECINDHQLDLVQLLAQQNRVVPAYEEKDLASAIREARTRRAASVPAAAMIDLIAQELAKVKEQTFWNR